MAERGTETSLEEIRKGKLAAVVGYICFLCIIPVFFKRHNRFAQFHGKQAFVLCCLEGVAFLIQFIPVMGEAIFSLGMVMCGMLSLLGMAKAGINQFWEMPVIYDLAEQLPFSWLRS